MKKITKNTIKRMAILKLWLIGDEIAENQSFTFTQICLAYGEALSKKYQNADTMIKSINNILRRMLKEGLLQRQERGLYRITDEGKRYYHNAEDDIIEALGEYLQKMKLIA